MVGSDLWLGAIKITGIKIMHRIKWWIFMLLTLVSPKSQPRTWYVTKSNLNKKAKKTKNKSDERHQSVKTLGGSFRRGSSSSPELPPQIPQYLQLHYRQKSQQTPLSLPPSRNGHNDTGLPRKRALHGRGLWSWDAAPPVAPLPSSGQVTTFECECLHVGRWKD